jgi:hypothetical protein
MSAKNVSLDITLQNRSTFASVVRGLMFGIAGICIALFAIWKNRKQLTGKLFCV